MSRRPSISVIVPTFNDDEWIEGCLTSLDAQKLAHSSFEVVVVPNGPPTRAAEIVRRFCAKHPSLQVQIVETATAGLSQARNVGIDAANGDYVVFLDVDDRVGPLHLSALLAVAAPDVIGGTSVATVREGRFHSARFNSYHSDGVRPFVHQEMHGRELIVFLTYPWAKIVSTERARQVRFDESVHHSEDTLFWCTLIARFPTRFALASTKLNAAYLYNVRSDSMMDHAAPPSWAKNVTRQLDVLRRLDAIQSSDPETEWMIREAEERHWLGEVWPYFAANPDETPRLAELVADNNFRHIPWRRFGLHEIPWAPGLYAARPDQGEPRRFLALIRSGASSLHPAMVQRLAEQNFDYALSWFGEGDPADLDMAEGAVFVDRVAGAKWPGLHATISAYRDVIDQYDYVWLPDDDLLCVPELVSQMFDIVAEHEADLAQPALDRASYSSYPLTLQHARFRTRQVSFVEAMAPIYRTEFLWTVLPLFLESLSGWGLDFVWPTLTRPDKMLIVDSTPVLHTRPVGGPNYVAAKAAGGLSPDEELQAVIARYELSDPWSGIATVGGTLTDGTEVSLDTAGVEAYRVLDAVASSWAPWELRTPGVAAYIRNHVERITASAEMHSEEHAGRKHLWHFRQAIDFKAAAKRSGLVRAIGAWLAHQIHLLASPYAGLDARFGQWSAAARDALRRRGRIATGMTAPLWRAVADGADAMAAAWRRLRDALVRFQHRQS